MTGRQHVMMWVAMGKAMAATIVAKAVTAMAEATDAAVRAVVKAVADRGWRGLLWKGSSANSGGPRWRRGRATRRSAVARATEKAAAETAAASVVARSAPARAPFSQCAILTSVECSNDRRISAESPNFAVPISFFVCGLCPSFLVELEFCSELL